MKQLFYSFFGLILLYFGSSSSYNPAADTFEKTIFIEIDGKQDSSLFLPYSKAWTDYWRYNDKDLYSNESEVMHAANYLKSFTGRKENLYTLLHPKVIDGSLTLYSPYDPAMLGLGGMDDGELRYPVKGNTPADNFYTSQELRDVMCYYLGQFGPQSDLPLIDEFGEPIVILLSDGTYGYSYPPSDYTWYKDSDIIKYKIRVRVIVNKKGIEKKRIIESICPVTYDNHDGLIIGERELFWLDYNEIVPLLEEGYFFNAQGKPVTYLKYINDQVKA